MRKLEAGTFSRLAPFLILGVIGIIVAAAFGAYYYLQGLNEGDLRETLLEETGRRQMESTRTLSNHIASDLDRVILRLQLLAGKPSVQRGEFASDETTRLLENTHADISRTTTLIHNVGLLDVNDIYVNNSLEEARERATGLDRSDQEYVIQTKSSMKPYVSSGFTNVLGDYVIAVAAPVINEDTGEYQGLVVTSFPVIEYFERYGNVLNFGTSSIVALDRNGKVISTFLSDAIGKDYFGDEVQGLLGPSKARDDVFKNVMAGKPDLVLFAANLGERIITGYPVLSDGKQVMSVVISTPTDAIYSTVDERMATSRLQVLVLLAATAAAVIALVVMVLRLNRTLDVRVREKTAELRQANEQLMQHDRMQTEFVNIAAHELRTPIQPILGMAGLLKDSLDGREETAIDRESVALLERNAQRLQKLSMEILDATRIESGTLRLDLVQMDINEKVRNAIADTKSLIPADRKEDLEIEFNPETDPSSGNAIPLPVMIDRLRMFEVLSNLIRNAIKYSEGEESGGRKTSITISTKKAAGGKEALVSVRDQGAGIHHDLMPRLFSKFAIDREKGGTGLGLYLAKNIVEAHGGRIWAENNEDGRGATFTFTLPLSNP